MSFHYQEQDHSNLNYAEYATVVNKAHFFALFFFFFKVGKNLFFYI